MIKHEENLEDFRRRAASADLLRRFHAGLCLQHNHGGRDGRVFGGTGRAKDRHSEAAVRFEEADLSGRIADRGGGAYLWRVHG